MQETKLPLKDLHLPEAISWWPPALGWWLLLLVILLVIVVSVWLYKRLTRNTALKTAGKKLHTLKNNPKLSEFQKLCELSVLIRRVAISLNPREQVASLTGRTWLKFLDKAMADAPFTEGIGQFLASAHYRENPVTEEEILQLISLCEDWLKAQAKIKHDSF